jgi:molybdopterin/thiamine biosynthesis adenylyltransferase
MVVNHARALDPRASPLTAKPVATDEDDGVFVYVDTFSSRAGITTRNQHLAMRKVVIVGLGGTGSYLLDLLAKTPIHEIHLYDGDIFGTHNAFRASGAASLEDLRAGLMKVEYYARKYARMHRGIRPHAVRVTSDNVDELLDADFVFLTMDSNPDKMTIVEALTDACVSFIDTGIGVSNDPNGIAGQIRVTTSTPGRTDHITRDGLISDVAGDDAEYDTNLQVAELKMMAAVQAIMRFKKLRGFYADEEDERHSVYVTHTNEIHSRYGQTDLAAAAASADPTDDHEPEVAA